MNQKVWTADWTQPRAVRRPEASTRRVVRRGTAPISSSARTRRSQPALTTVREYGAHPAYIEALARRIEAHWEKTGRPFAEGGKLLMSFHGLPKSCIAKGDRYEEDCRKTAALLAERGLAPHIICESAGTQAEDAQAMKSLYLNAVQSS